MTSFSVASDKAAWYRTRADSSCCVSCECTANVGCILDNWHRTQSNRGQVVLPTTRGICTSRSAETGTSVYVSAVDKNVVSIMEMQTNIADDLPQVRRSNLDLQSRQLIVMTRRRMFRSCALLVSGVRCPHSTRHPIPACNATQSSPDLAFKPCPYLASSACSSPHH